MGREVHSYELRQEIVKYAPEEGHTRKEAAAHWGVALYPVEKWGQCHGEKGLESRNRRDRAQSFTGEFRPNG